MIQTFSFFVAGLPIAKQYKATTKGIECYSKKVHQWEMNVAKCAMVAAGAGHKKFFGAVQMDLIFYFPIPKSRKELKPGDRHLQDPDLTNLVKCTEDGIKRVLIADDNLVWIGSHKKVWTVPGAEGVSIDVKVEELPIGTHVLEFR